MVSGKRCVFVGTWLALGLVCGTVAAASAATSRSVSVSVELPFEEVARRFSAWIERPPGEVPAAGELARVLREELVWIELGLFEVGLPEPALADERGLEAFRRACGALVAAQERWLAWRDPEAGPKSETARDFARLAEWIEGWDRAGLAAALATRADQPAIGLPGADAELGAAAARVASRMRGKGGAVRLALMPDRASFVEFLCFCGWTRPELRRHFWVGGIEHWTHFFVDDVQVYALEYAAPGAGDYRASTPMDARTETGIEQHVVALAANKLLDRAYGAALPASFVTGLGNELVIDLYGEVDTRVDGDLSERQTSAREVFVPGGASEGGTLPQLDADSPWREAQGRDHFASVLRRAQKRAAKAKGAGGTPSRDKLANFVLRGEGERGEWIVSAPLLGTTAGRELPASSFRGDYVEFLRAYQIAFVHWLRTEGGGSERKSRAAFAALLERLAQSQGEGFIEALEATYELPLSDAEASAKTLEGRFLRWISKQRSA